jgi:hypothetical protein
VDPTLDIDRRIETLQEHLEMLGRIHKDESGAGWNSQGSLVAASWQDAEQRAHRDFNAVVGHSFRVREIETIDGTVSCPGEGCLVTVVHTRESDIVRSVDDEHLDPYWNVELLSPSRESLGIQVPDRSVWIYGRSYRIGRKS